MCHQKGFERHRVSTRACLHTFKSASVRVGPWALTVKVYLELTSLFKPICQGNYIIILQI